jgi:SAM-dependent methyltransferase
VQFVTADLFSWRAPRHYDTVFFAFWLSHVPPAKFAAFWSMVRHALKPDGRVCFLDDTNDGGQDNEDTLAAQPAPAVRRRLGGGSQYRVVKVFYRPHELTTRLDQLGWRADIHHLGSGILAGTAAPQPGVSK